MAEVDPGHIAEMYGVLTSNNQPLPEQIGTAVVFGRKSRDLRNTVTIAAARSNFLVVSGGIGVDSGDLGPYGTEAGYLIEPLHYDLWRMPQKILVDTKAKSGIEGAQYATRLLAGLDETGGTVVGISHSTQSMRLGGLLRAEMRRKGMDTDSLIHHGSGYRFNPEDPFDQYEAAREIVRVDSYREGRRPYLVVPERPTKGMVAYAKSVAAQLKQDFRRQGVENPSTADDTPRSRSVLSALLDASVGDRLENVVDIAHLSHFPLELFVNAAKLGRASLKELRAKAGV